MTNKVKVTLQRNDGSMQTVEVEQDEIAQKAIVVYDNVFYTYGGMGGRFFSEIRFNEVEEPLYLNKSK